ncbi:MAG: SufS family cysteine desulfurase [Ilumatobacteraceae bacterium]|jgi:cysteine desulfurase / selenocysteine lyase|nr:SufS family cysteine desulfurase [Ilumatobacteraceae bacterium]
MSLDVAAIRREFPMLAKHINGKPVHYLDSANSSHKPNCVIDAMSTFMREAYAPIGRSSYTLAAEASAAYEAARTKVAKFINARSSCEVVFTKNATESLNLVAQSWGRSNLGKGDAILLTHMEHHANIVPWQMLAKENGFEIRWVPLTKDFQLDLSSLDQLLRGVKAFSFTSMSNVLGTINPTRELCAAAHAAGAIAIVDGCQSVPHMATDVQAMGADMLAFSSHKMCGPTGVGVLWAREELLEAMPPFLGGGGMISEVSLDGFTYAELPHKFEAGTPPIAEVIGLGAAVDFLNGIGMSEVRRHEIELTNYAYNALTKRYGDDITIHGPTNPELRGATFSFAFRDVHPHDVSQVLDQHNVCVRAGHHCAKPLMRLIGANATARASMYLYSNEADVDALVEALGDVSSIF